MLFYKPVLASIILYENTFEDYLNCSSIQAPLFQDNSTATSSFQTLTTAGTMTDVILHAGDYNPYFEGNYVSLDLINSSSVILATSSLILYPNNNATWTLSFANAPNLSLTDSFDLIWHETTGHGGRWWCKDYGNIRKAYITILGSTPPPATSSIAMHFPADNQTSTAPNFPYWEANLHINTSTIAGSMIYARIYFDTATHTSKYSYFIDTNAWPLSSWSGDALVLIPHSTLNPFTFNTTYFAYANILDNTGETYATSSLISFTTGNYGNMVATTTILIPQFTAPEASSTCSNYGWIGSELCQVGVFLFIPSSKALQNFVNIKDNVANKPPFGYFTAIQNALTGLSNSSTSVIISNSTASAFSSVFGRIRTAMTWILWLIFGFWLFHRIRNFEFQ